MNEKNATRKTMLGRLDDNAETLRRHDQRLERLEEMIRTLYTEVGVPCLDEPKAAEGGYAGR